MPGGQRVFVAHPTTTQYNSKNNIINQPIQLNLMAVMRRMGTRIKVQTIDIYSTVTNTESE